MGEMFEGEAFYLERENKIVYTAILTFIKVSNCFCTSKLLGIYLFIY